MKFFYMFCLLIPSLIFSQHATGDIDTLLVNQQIMIENQQTIIGEVEYIDPLAGKALGVEFNPAYFLTSSANENITITGGFSLFNIHPKAEIAFPIYYKQIQDVSYGEDSETYNSTFFTLMHNIVNF